VTVENMTSDEITAISLIGTQGGKAGPLLNLKVASADPDVPAEAPTPFPMRVLDAAPSPVIGTLAAGAKIELDIPLEVMNGGDFVISDDREGRNAGGFRRGPRRDATPRVDRHGARPRGRHPPDFPARPAD
jgi:hypothetical protein